jgi:alanine-glyoxylate transaminase/serine-glyoxylate transaminase/serine-pyruvate transaminase
MGPGPSDAHPSVLAAMSQPLIGHLDPVFIQIMDEIKKEVQYTFQTENKLSFVVSAPGSAGMETTLINLLEPGDNALICIHGVFGGRMAEIARRCGANVTEVHAEWGQHIEPDDVKKEIEKKNFKLVAIVHAETSTGVLQPLEEISKIADKSGALLVVDAVTSYCGCELMMDDWGIDAIYSGTQKCLSAPPGLSPVSFSEKALEALQKRKTSVQSWFLDLSLVTKYWEGGKRAYHHTAPISSMYALSAAYKIVRNEGLKNRWERHKRVHEYLKSGLEELDIRFLVNPDYRLPMLNAVTIPNGVNDSEIRNNLLNKYNIEIGGGLGPMAGKIWRIGIMGESCTENHVDLLLGALKELIHG